MIETAWPQNNKPHKDHKFFEKYLNVDLKDLTLFLEEKYKLIANAQMRGVDTLENDEKYWIESGSLSTVKWREYNAFQLYHTGLHELYSGISEVMKEACKYYNINFEKEQYYIQGWFNINHSDVGKLDWHDHGGPYAPHFHGYYCVSAEPSITYYKLFNDDTKIVENINKNNRLIISEMGHPHAMGDWDWNGSRITVAYDIIPLRMLKENSGTIEQHWIPLI